MKTNRQKGFIIPVLVAIIVVFIIGGSVYIYTNKKVEAPVVVDSDLSTQKDQVSIAIVNKSPWKDYTNDQLMALVKDQIEAEYFEMYNFLGLEDNYLILDSGTAPDPRGLSVFDLNSRKLVYSDRYSKPITIEDNSITYWSPISEQITLDNCPDSVEWKNNGLGAGIESQVLVIFANLIKKELGEFRCKPRQ